RITEGVKELAITEARSVRFGREPSEPSPWQPEGPEAYLSPIPAIPAQEWIALAGTPSDPVVAVAARGEGQYVAVADPHLATAEYVRAVAALYQSAGMGRDALAASYDQFRRRASSALGLGRSWNVETVAARLEARTGRPAAEVRKALAEVEAALQQPGVITAE